MNKNNRFNHKVVVIDPTIRKIIVTYIGLFKNQKEAALRIGVSACTINTYNTRSTNIALYVLEKMIKEIFKKLTPEEVNAIMDGKSLDEIRHQAQKQNGAQIDNVMYLITPGMRKILDLFVEPYPSRESAGADIGINPRTFTAYFKGQISSFPRNFFLSILDRLHARGISDDELLEVVGEISWDNALVSKKRSETLNVSKKELIQTLVKTFDQDSLREKDLDRSISNACERLFGNLGLAIRATIKEIRLRSVAEIDEALYQDNLGRAITALNRFERSVALYREKEEQINKSLPKEKKISLTRLLKLYLKTSQELEDKINDFVEAKSMMLFKSENALNAEQIVSMGNHLNFNQFQLIKRYSYDQSFQPGELIVHPALGVGEIVKLKSKNRMMVRFMNKKFGCKELVMNTAMYA